jgi:hypothetical protein
MMVRPTLISFADELVDVFEELPLAAVLDDDELLSSDPQPAMIAAASTASAITTQIPVRLGAVPLAVSLLTALPPPGPRFAEARQSP